MGCDTVFGEWLPTLGSSRRIMGCLTLKMKATQSFEMLGTACRVTQPYIPEDLICSSTSQNLKYCRKISSYAAIIAGLSQCWNDVLKCIVA